MYDAPGLCGSIFTSCLSGIRAPGLPSWPGRVDRDPADHLGVVALVLGQPQDDVEPLLPLDHLGERPAPDGDLHHGLDVRRR